MTEPGPRVTVLVPTYERPERLERTLDSILAQTYGDFRVLISDNASRDGTAAICERYASADERIRYARHPVNIGAVPNFNSLLERSQSEFTLMVADDDWLAPNYIERCLSVMDGDRGLAAVCAVNRYSGESPPSPLTLDLAAPSGVERVLRYLSDPWSGAGAFYGLLRTSAVRPALPIPNVMGADWIFVAALAYAGRIVTTSDTQLNREQGGSSATFEQIAQASGLSARSARHPHAAIAFNLFRDIGFSSRAYDDLPRSRRVALAAAGSSAVLARHGYHLLWERLSPLWLRPEVQRVARPALERWRERRSR